ncbi:MAG: tRNA (cmo5U34)-methyltransferase [Planctomycetota bacterium]
MSDHKKDTVFAKSLSDIKAFEFNETVANVFQDMISRSVPGYQLLLQMIGLYADIFVQNDSRVFDLGCSLGEASRIVAAQTSAINIRVIAVDNAESMIDKCRAQQPQFDNIEWCCQDIQDVDISNASMVILNLTLQFLQPSQRQSLLDNVYQGLKPGGVLVLSEKVIFEEQPETDRMIQLYHAFKKVQGYSDLEISQKRSALENVLIPDDDRLHRQRLSSAGFSEVYQCFRCFNFTSYLAIK